MWHYPGGYEWLDASRAISSDPVAKSDMVLTTGLPEGAYHFESYSPPPNLFLIFADTVDSEEGVKQFADQYGLLGLEREGAVMAALPAASSAGESTPQAADEKPGIALAKGELFSVWWKEIQQMRQAVALWSDLREAESGDTTRLSRHVQWHGGLVYYDTHPELPLPRFAVLLGIPPGPAPMRGCKDDDSKDELRTVAVIASRQLNSEWLKLFRIGDCLMPARYYLQRIVNEHLIGAASPQLRWIVKRLRPHDLALFFVPGNLLGLMWLQIAEAINGNRQYRRCAGCKTWIVISPAAAGSRSSRFTCSDACRMKVYYGRKLEARRLHQQGLGLAEIAARLKAGKLTVSRWVAAGRVKRALGKTPSRKS
jgi:hypothetical protein